MLENVSQTCDQLGNVINQIENFNHIAEVDVQEGVATKITLFQLYRLCQEFSVEFERIVPSE